ncbi:very short patch repair endonuclease [Kribbia dieselivorans]|uniref:very short patch repair endonuclease n=1 Tax=Kribbia dieselivorans TaxID=331526 RepID=UPI0009F90D04|nr:very short patch repair endonuclease [Kribbia dieselivorans]
MQLSGTHRRYRRGVVNSADDIPEHVRRRMSNTRGRDTKPEIALRRELFRRGLRYRVNLRVEPSLRRTVDIAFMRAKVVVLVDGCFWHGCPIHYVEPKTRADFWRQKIAGNRSRDRETTAALEAAGWTVLRFWEHESTAVMADRVTTAVRQPPQAASMRPG